MKKVTDDVPKILWKLKNFEKHNTTHDNNTLKLKMMKLILNKLTIKYSTGTVVI